jgi:hypothetical protein
MLVWLTVRLGDAVTQGRSSHPITVEGKIVRFFIAFSPGDGQGWSTARSDVREAVQQILMCGRIRLGVNDLSENAKMAYELPMISPYGSQGSQRDATLFDLERNVKRGDSLIFDVQLTDKPPPVPVLMRAVFEIEEAAIQPTLH